MASKKTETGIVDFPVQKATKKPRIAFGSTLREYRLKAHLEQEQVGKACGVTGNAISNWERDVARPDASLVPTLCNLLNIPLYDFFGMENPNPYSSDEKALVADYRYMTDPNKRQLRSIVSAIIDSQEETRRENYRKNFCHLVGHDAGLAAGFGQVCDKGSSNIAQKDLAEREGQYPIYGAAGLIKNVDFAHQKQPYIAVVKDGAGIGRVMKLPAYSSVIGTMQYIFPTENVDIDYLFYALQHMNLGKYFSGSTIPHIYFRDYQKERLKLPVMEVQQRQADTLSRIDAISAYGQRQIALMDEIVKSRFVEMFGEPLKNAKGWIEAPLIEVAPIRQLHGLLQDEVWLLNLDAIESQTGVILFKQRVPVSEINASTVYFTVDSVLYSKLRPYLNKVVMPDENGIATSELLPMYPIPNKLNRTYLCHWLRSDAFVKHISEKVAGAKMPRVAMDYFRSLSIELPPLELQNRFAAFVTEVDKSKLAVKQSLEKLETLKKSLMQQYFG